MLRAKQNCMANILLMPAKCLGGGRRIFCTFCAVSIIEIFFFKRATAAAADKIIAKMPQFPKFFSDSPYILFCEAGLGARKDCCIV